MDKILKLIGLTMGTFATLFLLRLIGPALGAFAGWLVGLVFGDAVFSVLRGFGVDTTQFAMWQLGAALSFIGAFFVITIDRQK
jgi:hypothetical protein